MLELKSYSAVILTVPVYNPEAVLSGTSGIVPWIIKAIEPFSFKACCLSKRLAKLVLDSEEEELTPVKFALKVLALSLVFNMIEELVLPALWRPSSWNLTLLYGSPVTVISPSPDVPSVEIFFWPTVIIPKLTSTYVAFLSKMADSEKEQYTQALQELENHLLDDSTDIQKTAPIKEASAPASDSAFSDPSYQKIQE